MDVFPYLSIKTQPPACEWNGTLRGKRCVSTLELCLVMACLLTKMSGVLMQGNLVCMGLKTELEHFIAQNANNQVVYSVDVQ